MTIDAHQLACSMWVGAVLERLRRGELPVALDLSDPMKTECAVNAELATFGWHGLPACSLGEPWGHVECPPIMRQPLAEIASRVRGQRWEREFWASFIPSLAWPPPDEVLNDLVRREVHVDLIGHLPLSDAMLWSLADRVDEAILTLAKRRFVSHRYDAGAFEEVLHAFPTHAWMVKSLVMIEASSENKVRVLARYVRAAPPEGRDRLLRNPGETFERMWREESVEGDRR